MKGSSERFLLLEGNAKMFSNTVGYLILFVNRNTNDNPVHYLCVTSILSHSLVLLFIENFRTGKQDPALSVFGHPYSYLLSIDFVFQYDVFFIC